MTTVPPPLRPPTPPRATPLQGRDGDLELLQAAVLQARRSSTQMVWISGEAGVGKTALVQHLRQPVQQAGGRFALGKCEQFLGSEVLQAPRQALRQLLLQLPASPGSHLQEELPIALRSALGRDATTLVPLLPELERFCAPLSDPPALEAYEVPQRLLSLLVALLRALARLCRPLVLVLDDLQWADPLTLDLLRALLEAPDLHGLVVIGLLRPTGLEAEAPLERLLLQASSAPTPPLHLELNNLTRDQVTALLGDRLGSDPEPLVPLSDLISGCTGGNPFFVIELLHSLQRQGLLRRDPESQRWLWEADALSERLGNRDVVSLLCATLTGLPAPCRNTLLALACLGSRSRLGLLALATGQVEDALLDALQPALEMGIVIWCQETPPAAADPEATLGFGHDRLQQAVLQPVEPSALQHLNLALARRLLGGGQRLLAAEQYAQATALLETPEERRQVLALLQEAGAAALAAGGFAMADRLHQLAWPLLGAAPWQEDPGAAWSLQARLHQLAYCRADYSRGDTHYSLLERRAATAEQLLDPTAIQVLALSNRGRHQEAVDLAARLLHRLAQPMPTEAPQPALERELQALQEAVQAGALERLPPIPADVPPGGSVAKLMNRLVPAAFFCNPPLACWLVLHSTQQWLAGDAHPARLYPLACTLLASVALRDDYALGHRAARAALATAEASGHGVETARTRHVTSLFCCHWFEPLETALAQARLAHRDLQRWGEQDFACYTFYTSQAALLDCGSSLAELAAENARGVALARRSGNRHAEPAYAAFGSLIEALRDPDGAGRPHRDAGPPRDSRAGEDDRAAIQALERSNPMGACYVHLCRALAACLLNDPSELKHHAEAAGRLEGYITGFYPVALIRLLQLLALLWHRDAAPEPGSAERLETLESWFRARAADAPRNFGHLEALIQAERALAEGDGFAALPLYERAMRSAISHQRPWHAALACERAARCYLQLGLEQAGQHLIEQAQRRYSTWGATRKSHALEREFPLLGVNRPLASDGRRLLEASQSLGRLRTLPELVEATAQLIGELSGASDVQIVTLDSEEQWQLRGGFSAQCPLERLPLEQAERHRLLPATALRLCLESLQPLVCDDAVLDPRFACDPYLEGLTSCALLVVPVVLQQRAIAAVLASHRLQHGGFAGEQVEAVQLLCGHLGVALETLLVQQSLEQQVQERSDALRRAYERESRHAQQQRDLLRQKLKTSLIAAAAVHEIQQPLASILLTCRLAVQNLEEPCDATASASLIEQLRPLADAVEQVSTTMERMQLLLRNVETEPSLLDLSTTLHSALAFQQMELRRQEMQLLCEGFAQPCPMQGDAAQRQMAVVNLIRNALQAMEQQPPSQRRLLLQLEQQEQQLLIRMADSGPGFPDDFSGCDTSWETLRSSRATGMGIGLFLAQTTAGNHRGDLRIARSAVLGGAEVVISLPCPQPPAGDLA